MALAIAQPGWEASALFPGEAAYIAAATERRRREFTAGRRCAREALHQLGVPATALAATPQRAPQWPAGHVGSITHCEGFCGAVAARRTAIRALGIDAEPAAPLDPSLIRLVCRPEEQARFAPASTAPGCGWPKLTFVAKEAFYKAYFEVARTFLDFLDVDLRFTTDPAGRTGTFSARIVHAERPHRALAERVEGRWLIVARHVHAGATLMANSGPEPLGPS